MHTPIFALEALELLWHNYHVLGENVDVHRMPSEKSIKYAKGDQRTLRALSIAAYLSNLGCFVSVWALWELYSWELCSPLPIQRKGDSVKATATCLAANGIPFPKREWFEKASGLRNIIAHYSGRVSGEKAEKHFQNAKAVFDISTNAVGYVNVEHEHICDLYLNVEDFIKKTAEHYPEMS
jgi:hypothetical protein